MNIRRRHQEEITLLGGYIALVEWVDGRTEGEIVLPDPDFFSYIHEHTRRDAKEKAIELAPHIEKWSFVQ